MGIGAISSVSMSYSPQIYNVNGINTNSLNRISPISDKLTKSDIDFTGLVGDDEKQETVNPLRRGETANFADVLASQMAMGSMMRDKLGVAADPAMMMQQAQHPGADAASISQESKAKLYCKSESA